MIELNSALTDVLENGGAHVHLITIELAEGTLYFTTGTERFEYGGVTYQAGHISSIPQIDQTGEPRVGAVNLTFHAVTDDLNAVFLASNYVNAPVKIEVVYFSKACEVVGVLPIYKGRIASRSGSISLDKSTLTLKVASHWADFKSSPGRHTNLNSQQMYYPDDKGFEFCGLIQEDIEWGQGDSNQYSVAGSAVGGGSRGSGAEQPYEKH